MAQGRKLKLSTRRIRKVLLGRRGAMKEVADALGVTRSAVSQRLSEKMPSEVILEACRIKAEAILAGEGA